MRIKTLDFASGRTRDGRQVTALTGATLEVDDNDRDKVDLFRSFVAQGVAELVDVEPQPAEDQPETAQQPSVAKKAVVKKAAGRPA